MKKALIIFAVFLLLGLMPFSCCASIEYDINSSIENSLDDNTREFLNENNIHPDDGDLINSLKPQNVFSYIFSLFKGGGKAPLKSGFTVLGIILIAAAIKAFDNENSADTAIKFCVALCISAVLISGVWSSINTAVNAIKGSSTFMLSFVPVYMSIISVSGAPVTAAASGGLILTAAEFISSSAAFFITAVMGAYLSISICTSLSTTINANGFAECIKRVGIWTMSLFTTVFLGLISAGTAVNSAADSLTVKTAKFILGTCVPVAGTALSGAVNTVAASLTLLKSSVGIYGVIALCVMLLPILAELFVWRLVLGALSGVCILFSAEDTSKTFRAVDSMISFLIGAVLLVSAAFIISLFVTVSLGRTV